MAVSVMFAAKVISKQLLPALQVLPFADNVSGEILLP